MHPELHTLNPVYVHTCALITQQYPEAVPQLPERFKG
jgi:hypothetical protein